MKQEASVELCPTLNMIGYYFTKALQGYQLCCFCNIILVIHEDYIPNYNASGRYFLEEQKLKLRKEKEEAHNYSKITGDQVNQGVCWEKHISRSLLTDYQ